MERKIKIFKHKDGNSQTSSINPHVDDESNDSKKNVDEESRILLVTTPGARMANKTLKTPNYNNVIQKFTYDGFVFHHYATW
jgi:ADP-heptose:LPS heptosyltransferase